jgi:hypothetical protein
MFRSGLKHDVFELLAAREAIEIRSHNAPSPVPPFYLVEIRRRQLLQSQSCTRSRVPVAVEYDANTAIA